MTFDDYERRERANYAEFAIAISNILNAAIKADPAYRLQQIQSRAKEPASLKEKLEKFKLGENAHIESEVKDLAACRAIFYTNADVRRFISSDILRDNFVIDWDKTKVHHPVPGTETERRLFISDNFVVQLTDQIATAPEYVRFRGMLCEIQVQTTLNHAWSEMEHDVYKIKLAAGFGKNLLEGLQKRFDKVMRDMLIPAGYEFQKIVYDYNRLASGRELFEKGALKSIAECTDNNKRYELLDRFKTHVLPHLDSPVEAHAEIRDAVLAAVHTARKTESRSVKTPWGDLQGKSAEDVLELATDILDHLRYISLDAVEVTFDTLCELFSGAASGKELEHILKSVESLAEHNYEVWKAGGPIVQDILVRRMQRWDAGTLEALRPLALTVLNQALRPEATGTSSTYKTVTLTTANLVSSKALTSVRAASIDLLEQLFRMARNDSNRSEVQQALLKATRFPRPGSANSALRLNILENSIRVARFFTSVATTLSHELLQTLEERFLWLYRHTRRPIDAPADDAPIAAARSAFVEAILAFRDQINTDRDFVVYKTLVGFESVFPLEWEGDPINFGEKETYRNACITQLVADVSRANADAWLTTLQRCARTKSSDLATFPSFGRFLEELGRAKPDIMESYLDRLGEDLARFLPAMLLGMEATHSWGAARRRIAEWVAQHRYLAPILRHQRFTRIFDAALIADVLNLAVEGKDDLAVMSAAEICVVRSDEFPYGQVCDLFSSAISYFNSKGDTSWANVIWPIFDDSSLPTLLSDEHVDQLLSALVMRRSIDTAAEWILSTIAKRYPDKIVDFFGDRLAQRESDHLVDGYEAVPFDLTRLGPQLAAVGNHVLARCRDWHHERPEYFEYRGGRLLSVLFPEVTPNLEGYLSTLLATDGAEAAQFIVNVLYGYRGSPATHAIYKLIINVLPNEDELLGSIERALIATDVVQGEFGMVEAYRRKKNELQHWLTDARPRVRAYAERHDRMLDRMIAAEQRRGEQDLESRRREFGDERDTRSS